MPRLQRFAAQARGILLGAAVGDALGWPQEQNSGIVGGNRTRHIDPVPEFRSWTRNGGTQYQRYADPVAPGAYSDDTQLTLASGRAVQTDDWFGHLVRSELPLFLLYQRGAGGATLRACRTWAAGRNPWDRANTQKAHEAVEQYFHAGGNGVAMRIAPHAIASVNAGPEELVARVTLDGVATHGHPRALVGAAAYATALHLLLTVEGTLEFGDLTALIESDKTWQNPEVAFSRLPEGWLDSAATQNSGFQRDWEATLVEMRRLLTQAGEAARAGTTSNDMATLDALGCFDKKINGSGTITAAAAIYLASRHAPRPMSALLRAAFLKNADTDTLASMTGALMGALHGHDWLGPLAGHLQDHKYIERMADNCASRALGQAPPPSSIGANAVGERALKRFRDQLQTGGAPRLLPDDRPCVLVEDIDLEARGRLRAHRWALDADGQTIIVDQTARGPQEETSRSAQSPISGRNGRHSIASNLNRISLRTSDLMEIERFYRDGIGVPVDRIGPHELLVAGLVRFVEDPDTLQGSGQILLSFEVGDIAKAAARLAANIDPKSARFRVRDPGGNDVDVRRSGEPF